MTNTATTTNFTLPTEPAADTVIDASPTHGEWWAGAVNGEAYGGLYGKSEAEAIKKAQRAAVTMAQDAYLSPLTIAALNGYVATDEDLTAAPQPGDVVAAYSRQSLRPVVVVKVGRKNAEIACTTASNPGRVTRKSVPLHLLARAVAR